MNRYGNAQMDSKRDANSKVVKMVLKEQVSKSAVAGSVGFRGVSDSTMAMAKSG
jgi:hypothetical protein